jgi:hypothetical protein
MPWCWIPSYTSPPTPGEGPCPTAAVRGPSSAPDIHLQKHGLTRIGAIPRCLADRIMFRHHAPLCSQETVRGWVAPACACAPNVTWASLASISTTILSQLRQPVIGHVWQGIVYEPTATWIGGQNSPKAHRYRMIPSGTSASRNIQTSS